MREPRRLRRRRLTRRVALRRLAEHQRFDHIPFMEEARWRCVCDDVGLNWWSRHRPHSCDCRKRQHGRPRVAAGMCDIGARIVTYRQRNQVRELRRLVVGRGYDGDSDEVALLANPTMALY